MTFIDGLSPGLGADFGAAVAWATQLYGRSAHVLVTSDEVMWRFADVAWVQRRPDRERHTAAQAKANLVPVQRARPGDNDSLNSVMGLPAPFGPRKPVTRPGRTVKLRSSTAVTGPKRLLIRSTSIMPADSTPFGGRVPRGAEVTVG